MSDAARSRNREAMPQFAAVVDEFRRCFGAGVKVRWAKEGELEVGARPPVERSMSGEEWVVYLRTGIAPGGGHVHP